MCPPVHDARSRRPGSHEFVRAACLQNEVGTKDVCAMKLLTKNAPNFSRCLGLSFCGSKKTPTNFPPNSPQDLPEQKRDALGEEFGLGMKVCCS